jgi:hypothetical protein
MNPPAVPAPDATIQSSAETIRYREYFDHLAVAAHAPPGAGHDEFSIVQRCCADAAQTVHYSDGVLFIGCAACNHSFLAVAVASEAA